MWAAFELERVASSMIDNEVIEFYWGVQCDRDEMHAGPILLCETEAIARRLMTVLNGAHMLDI